MHCLDYLLNFFPTLYLTDHSNCAKLETFLLSSGDPLHSTIYRTPLQTSYNNFNTLPFTSFNLVDRCFTVSKSLRFQPFFERRKHTTSLVRSDHHLLHSVDFWVSLGQPRSKFSRTIRIIKIKHPLDTYPPSI